MPVIGERDHDLRSGAQELSVQLADRVGVVEHHLGHEGAALDVPAPLELEEVALGAEHRPFRQPLQQSGWHGRTITPRQPQVNLATPVLGMR